MLVILLFNSIENYPDAYYIWCSYFLSQCLDAQRFLHAHGFNSEHLQTDDFLAICPSIVFLLDVTDCSKRTSDRNLRRSARDVHSEDECIRLGCGPPNQTTDGDSRHSDFTNGTMRQHWHMPSGSGNCKYIHLGPMLGLLNDLFRW